MFAQTLEAHTTSWSVYTHRKSFRAIENFKQTTTKQHLDNLLDDWQ